MLYFVDGDLFDIEANVRVNTVNCVGVMGKGVALAFKQRYPQMFSEYRKACKPLPGFTRNAKWTLDETKSRVCFFITDTEEAAHGLE